MLGEIIEFFIISSFSAGLGCATYFVGFRGSGNFLIYLKILPLGENIGLKLGTCLCFFFLFILFHYFLSIIYIVRNFF